MYLSICATILTCPVNKIPTGHAWVWSRSSVYWWIYVFLDRNHKHVRTLVSNPATKLLDRIIWWTYSYFLLYLRKLLAIRRIIEMEKIIHIKIPFIEKRTTPRSRDSATNRISKYAIRFFVMCGRWDSNPHAQERRILSPLCMPFHHTRLCFIFCSSFVNVVHSAKL